MRAPTVACTAIFLLGGAVRAQAPDTAVKLPGVAVTEAAITDRRLMEFERRRAHGGGAFVTPPQLQEEQDRPLTETLSRRIPSLVITTRNGDTELPWAKYAAARNGPKGLGCYPDIYIDGSPISAPTGATDISGFATREFVAIEYHTGSNVPPQYNRPTNGCGAILLWRKLR